MGEQSGGTSARASRMPSMDCRPAKGPAPGPGTARMKTPAPRPIAQGEPTRNELLASELPGSGSSMETAEWTELDRSIGLATIGSVGTMLLGVGCLWCLSASRAAVRLLDGEPAWVLLSRMVLGVIRTAPQDDDPFTEY